jgi:UDP-N-acetylglucosamine 4-epimerase
VGDGEQTRDFVYVSDVVQANLLAGLKPLPQAVAVFNVGRGQQTSLNQIVVLLNQINSIPLQYVYGAARHGDIRHSVADISLIAQVLGYSPQVSLREGLEQTLRWFQAMV